MNKAIIALAAVSFACNAATNLAHTHKLARDELSDNRLDPATGKPKYRLCGYDQFDGDIVLVMPAENACPATLVIEGAK